MIHQSIWVLPFPTISGVRLSFRFAPPGFRRHIARCIDAVHVAEGRGHGEVAVGHGGQRLVDLPDLLGLRVETRGIHVRVVHTVLFATGDAWDKMGMGTIGRNEQKWLIPM